MTWFALSTILPGVVHATTCTLPAQAIICIATDRTIYRPGGTVRVTVSVTYKANVFRFEVVIMPTYAYPYGSPTASRLMRFPIGTTETVSLKLPTNTAAGQYTVGLGSCTNLILDNGQIVCGDYTFPFFWSKALTITVTGP